MDALSIQSLTSIDSIKQVDASFKAFLTSEENKMFVAYQNVYSDEALQYLSTRLEDFILQAFDIEEEYFMLKKQLSRYDVLDLFLNKVSKPVLRKLKNLTYHRDQVIEMHRLIEEIQGDERRVVNKILKQFSHEALSHWCAYIANEKVTPYINWQVFQLPKKIDFNQLVSITSVKPRFDYQYTGKSLSDREISYHIRYCIDCHLKNNDSCSKGLYDKRENKYKVSAVGRVLTGCPLNQKISQMHVLRKTHNVIAALAVTMVDNPLCLVTGDRICNDCMAACIYQKFESVDTPSVESDTLSQVLNLPYGAEIYLLLARWNPLIRGSYYYQSLNKGSTAVIGMGPAGFAMSYYLLMSGAQVAGFDGLPIRKEVGDVYTPIKHFSSWVKRFLQGQPLSFGGVIDYGITARWNKDLIVLVWVLLHRFPRFSVIGNVRFGGALTIDKLYAMGFDQVVLATGAGLPKAHQLQKHQGMLFANEFLMRLQISGMMHKTLKEGIQLPIVVVGGGLTGVDAATEAQVYYIKWVEQVAFWLDAIDSNVFREQFLQADKDVIKTWQEHGQMIRRYRHSGQEGKVYQLIKNSGGISILYRQAMQSSPAYKTNHIEIEKALSQGVEYREYHNPMRVITCQRGRVSALVCDNKGREVLVAAKTVLFATGSKPNIAYYYEHRKAIEIENGYYKRVNDFSAVSEKYPGFITIIGDLHPMYQGSVVGALASAKDSYLGVLKQLEHSRSIAQEEIYNQFTIQISSIEDLGEVIAINLETRITLPAGSYIKVNVLDAESVVSTVRAIVVSQNMAYAKVCPLSRYLLQNRIVGVLGPSGVRLVGSDIACEVAIIADKENIIWACAVSNALKEKGKSPILFIKDDLPDFSKGHFDIIHHPKQLLDTLNDSMDLYYCVGANEMKQYQKMSLNIRKAFGIVDGPMMCFLKGVCGQCIQWQISEGGAQLKAVYACSWSSQPITLIDCDHLLIRQQDNIDRSFYHHCQREMRKSTTLPITDR